MARLEINISISGDGLVTGLNISEHPVPGGIVPACPGPFRPAASRLPACGDQASGIGV